MKRLFVVLCVLSVVVIPACSGSGSDPTGPGGGGGTNHPPSVSINTSTTHLSYNATATITVSATDTDGDQLSYAYAATAGSVSASGPTATTATYTATNHWGPATVTVTVTDGKGGSTPATATMYIRNPGTPSIVIEPIGSANCGYGTTRPDCFQVQMTSPEALVVTGFMISASDVYGCDNDWVYAGINVAGNVPYMFDRPGAPSCAACSPCNGSAIGYWDVYISGHRPEPDGGDFVWHVARWSP